MQTELTFSIHQHESPKENEVILKNGEKTFTKNCSTLFWAFMRGEVINSDNSPVREFRRRRQDLTDENGVWLSYHSNSGNLRNWHMTPDDIKKNKEKFGIV